MPFIGNTYNLTTPSFFSPFSPFSPFPSSYIYYPSSRRSRRRHRSPSRSRSHSRSRDRSDRFSREPHNPYRPDRDDERQFARVRQVECTLDYCTYAKPHFHEAFTMPTPPPPPPPPPPPAAPKTEQKESEKKEKTADPDRFPFDGLSSNSERWERIRQFMAPIGSREEKNKLKKRGLVGDSNDKPELLLKMPGTYYSRRSVEPDEGRRIMGEDVESEFDWGRNGMRW